MFSCCTGKKPKQHVTNPLLEDCKKLKDLEKMQKLCNGELMFQSKKFLFDMYDKYIVLNIESKSRRSFNKYIDLCQTDLAYSAVYNKEFKEADKQEVGVKIVKYQVAEADSNSPFSINVKEIILYIDVLNILQAVKQHLYIKLNQTEFRWQYKTIELLGEGSSGTVFNVIHRDNMKQYAAKVLFKPDILKQEFGRESIIQEIDLMKKMSQSEYTIKLHEIFEDEKNYYLILDLYNGGCLQDRLDNQKGPFMLQDAIHIVRQILKGVIDLHKQGIMHRDIKPDNILFKKIKKYDLVLCDLGLATEISKEKYLFQHAGTPGFVAPEVFYIKGQYKGVCDIYSVGIIFYHLVCLKSPFKSKELSDLIQENKKNRIKLDMFAQTTEPEIQIISLLNQMLERDPNKRITPEDCLNHPLFQITQNEPIQLRLDVEAPMRGKAITVNPSGAYGQGQSSPQQQEQNLEESRIIPDLKGKTKDEQKQVLYQNLDFKMPNTPLLGKIDPLMDQVRDNTSSILSIDPGNNPNVNDNFSLNGNNNTTTQKAKQDNNLLKQTLMQNSGTGKGFNQTRSKNRSDNSDGSQQANSTKVSAFSPKQQYGSPEDNHPSKFQGPSIPVNDLQEIKESNIDQSEDNMKNKKQVQNKEKKVREYLKNLE